MSELLVKGAVDQAKVPVKVRFRDGSGRIVSSLKIEITFRKLSRSAYKSHLGDVKDDLEENDVRSEAERTMLLENILGWDNVLSPSDEPLPFNRDALNAVLDVHEYFDAIAAAFVQLHTTARLKQKNS